MTNKLTADSSIANVEYDAIMRCDYVFKGVDTDTLIFEHSSSSIEEKYLEMWWLKNLNFKENWFKGEMILGYDIFHKITPNQEFVKLFNDFLSLSPQEKFKKALETEYGCISQEFANLNKFSFKKIQIKDIHTEQPDVDVAEDEYQIRRMKIDYHYYLDDANSLIKDEALRYIPFCVLKDGKWTVVKGNDQFNILKHAFSVRRKIWVFTAK